MVFRMHLLAVTGGVESDDALWIPLHAETGPKEDHAVLALQHIWSIKLLTVLKLFSFQKTACYSKRIKKELQLHNSGLCNSCITKCFLCLKTFPSLKTKLSKNDKNICFLLLLSFIIEQSWNMTIFMTHFFNYADTVLWCSPFKIYSKVAAPKKYRTYRLCSSHYGGLCRSTGRLWCTYI